MRKVKIDNPQFPHDILIYRVTQKKTTTTGSDSKTVDDDDPFAETGTTTDNDTTTTVSEEKEIIYQGKGMSYTDTTTTGDGKVEDNKRKISIPVRYDKWQDKWPLDGDTVEVTMGNVKEKGTVKDFEPDNFRSVVYWELLRV